MSEDVDQIIDFTPEGLSPFYADRFEDLTTELVEYPKLLNREVTIKEEIKYVEDNLHEEEPDPDAIRYLAVLEVLLDLIEIDWGIQKNDDTRVVRPDMEKYRSDPDLYKERERKILRKERQVQFQKDSIKRFIREMEEPKPGVGDLITDNESLYDELATLAEKPREVIIDGLDDAIQPYVQTVVKGETCEKTGLDLMDIWRYFRYTWLTPYNTVPGRNINFLIRDAAREFDPVIGIASLASAMMNLSVRDNHIGWRFEEVKRRLDRKSDEVEIEEPLPKEERTPEKKTRTRTKTIYRETPEEYEERKRGFCKRVQEAVVRELERSISEIRVDDFIDEYDGLSEDSFEDPDETTFEILAEIEENAREIIDDPTIDEQNPEKLDSWERRSETPLFRKKRSEMLQRLLRDRHYVQEHADQDPVTFVEKAIEDPDGKRSLKTGLKEVKKRRAGAGMMNIMVCGAIPPYRSILGGKLVAMALTGPEVINAYREKYSGAISQIASSMKGEAITKENGLVFLDTTSLFEVGSAQYDRVRVPTPSGTKMEYEELGKTSGYGSIQFGPKTRQRLAEVTVIEEGKSKVRGRFGEGIAPRMRKIRNGIENLGLDGELLQHQSRRIVYGVDLAEDAEDYLFGLTNDPEYYWDFDNVTEEQRSIYDYWKQRWVSKRIQRDDVLEQIRDFDQSEFMLQNEVTYKQKQLSDFIVEN
jgi:hypothetical protein